MSVTSFSMKSVSNFNFMVFGDVHLGAKNKYRRYYDSFFEAFEH
jgi:hypothetical protein